MYRPPGFATVPAGWVLLERPKLDCGFDRRIDLPVSSYMFGVIGYSKPLSDDDVKRYELKIV
jgi:hypothetical protein